MQRDYLITIFSKRKGTTSSFRLGRRFLYILFLMLILLVSSSIFFGRAFFQERGERQLLQKRLVQLESSAFKLTQHLAKQREALSKADEEPASSAPAIVEAVKEEEVGEDSGEANSLGDGKPRVTTISANAVAKIDDPRVSTRLDGGPGFRFEFKLINKDLEPISGNVAIIASLAEPHQPRFVSYPSMKLVDGAPVRLRKSVRYHIQRFKYMAGKFSFPFSYARSFRILIYDLEEQLLIDTTIPIGEIDVSRLIS
jgi:hypothetical protein